MEYCGGGSVAEICKILDSGLEEDYIRVICREALKGLKYLHKMQKIHRDVKGGNILLTETGQVKLGMHIGHVNSLLNILNINLFN